MTTLLFSLLLFSVYLHSAAPTLYGGDSGELITSGVVLGLPHAPGYPVYCVLAKAATLAIPWGGAPLRINVLSAFLGVTALALFYALLKRWFHPEAGRWPALAAVMVVAFSPVFVEQSSTAEVFMLNAVFLLAISICLVRSVEGPADQSKRLLMLAWFLFGLGMGNHHTLVVVLPFLAWRSWPYRRDYRLALTSFLLVVLGASIYLYLPLRAMKNPPVNFGDPETFSRFWKVVTRKEFGALSLHPAMVPFRDWLLFKLQIWRFMERGFHQLGGLGTFVAFFSGVAGLFFRPMRKQVAILLGVWMAWGFGFEWLSNLSPGSEIGQWRLERFFLIPVLAMAGLISLSAVRLSRQGRVGQITAAVITALVLINNVRAWASAPSQRNNPVFQDFGVSLLRQAPKDGLLIVDRILFDEPTSCLLVAKEVQNKRDDLTVAYRPGTLFDSVYGEDLLDLNWDRRFDRQFKVERHLLEGFSKSKCFAFERANTPYKRPRLSGYLYQDGKDDRTPAALIVRRSASTRYDDFPSRLMAVHDPYLRGKARFEAGDIATATRYFNDALNRGERMEWLWSNIGGLYAQAALLRDAKNCYLKSIEINPYFPQGHFGLGFVALQEKDFQQAIFSYSRAVRTGPDSPENHYMLGVAYAMAGDEAAAAGPWKEYLRLAPHGAQADAIRLRLD